MEHGMPNVEEDSGSDHDEEVVHGAKLLFKSVQHPCAAPLCHAALASLCRDLVSNFPSRSTVAVPDGCWLAHGSA